MMRRSLIALIILTAAVLALAARTPSIGDALSQAHAFLPFVARQATPTPTLRPRPGIKLDYAVVLTQPETLAVSMAVHDIDMEHLTLYRVVRTAETLPPITGLTVTDADGRPVVYEMSTLGPGTRNNFQQLTLTIAEGHEAFITYTLDLASQLHWRADEEFVGLSENQAFLQPRGDETTTGEMHFRFSVPAGWRVVTRLTPIGEMHLANLDDSFQMARPDGWWRFFLAGPLAIGDFAVLEARFGDVRCLAAYRPTDGDFGVDAAFLAPIYAYSNAVMGHQSRGVGDIAFLYVFAPWRAGSDWPDTLELHGQFEAAHVDDYHHLGHEVFHQRFSCGIAYDAWRAVPVGSELVEGLVDFFGLQAHEATAAMTAQRADEWRLYNYDQYTSVLLGTPNDVPLVQCPMLVDSEAWRVCMYRKGHLVVWLLDEVLCRVTNGEVNMEDVAGSLFANYASDPTSLVTVDHVRQAATELSGHDFQPFFDAYILGPEALPIAVQDGELTILWDQLPWMS